MSVAWDPSALEGGAESPSDLPEQPAVGLIEGIPEEWEEEDDEV